MSNTIVNHVRVRELMKEKGISLSGVARMCGVSRQRLHGYLKPDYSPFSRGFLAMAEVLEVAPETLLCNSADNDMMALLELSGRGDARAFELLPAAMLNAQQRTSRLASATSVEQQLARAALALLDAMGARTNDDELSHFLKLTSHPNAAYFFGADLMPPNRIVAMTPEAMQRHLVFGAFCLSDFERHLPHAVS
jgi:transcriptional regulator with XRE-family HTH domain